jgi:hypothetical protein
MFSIFCNQVLSGIVKEAAHYKNLLTMDFQGISPEIKSEPKLNFLSS